MARYIDAELALKIIDNYSKSVTEDGKVVVDAIKDIVAVITPTADVAPKSEAAMEIFEEIYKLVASKIQPHIRPIFKDDMDFEDGFRNGKTDALIEVLMLIAELKKKYTEDKIT